MSQADFADLSGIGKASLSRWERGALIQNEANDNLLRLMHVPENVERLIGIHKPVMPSNVIPFAKKFERLSTKGDEQKLKIKASQFQLYG